MERFKVLEKETKTKAYSKEGLNSNLKKSHAAKNAPKAKQLEWIEETISTLQDQVCVRCDMLRSCRILRRKRRLRGAARRERRMTMN